VQVKDAYKKLIDLKATVVVNRLADASVVREKVNSAISDYFNVSNWELGEPFYVSQLLEVLNAIDGVKYIDLFMPSDNILQSQSLVESASSGTLTVAINEIITLANSEISFYYEARS